MPLVKTFSSQLKSIISHIVCINFILNRNNRVCSSQLKIVMSTHYLRVFVNFGLSIKNQMLRIDKDLIEELTDEAELVKEAKGLISLKKDLQGYKKQLNQGLDYYTRIPILPKNCKYIGWALPGFLDTIKGKLKWTLKPKISTLKRKKKIEAHH